MIPIQNFGFVRKVYEKYRSKHRSVIYKSPCGQLLKSIQEVSDFLTTVKQKELNVGHFTFETETLCMHAIDDPANPIDNDLSKGIEPLPIQVVNNIDGTSPAPFQYSNEWMLVGFKFDWNAHKNALCACDCTDGKTLQMSHHINHTNWFNELSENHAVFF